MSRHHPKTYREFCDGRAPVAATHEQCWNGGVACGREELPEAKVEHDKAEAYRALLDFIVTTIAVSRSIIERKASDG